MSYKNNKKVTKKPLKLAALMSLMGLLVVIGVVIKLGSKPAAAYAAVNSAKLVDSAAVSSSTQAAANSAAINSSNGAASSSQNKSAAAKPTTASSQKATTKTTTVVAAPAVSSSKSLYAWPGSQVAQKAGQYSSSAMAHLAATPMAIWLTGGAGDAATVATVMAAASAANQVPVFVAYNIPERDCGSYSSGGASSAAAYQNWIDSISNAIGQRQAIVIVEPDALAGMDCLSSADQTSRIQLINYAVQSLRKSGASIYIDAGNSNWQSTSTMAARLQQAGIAQATGFSLNVSSFQTTASSTNYGDSLAAQVGGKHFVIDTSRNGNGPDANNDWCNPDGRAFGNAPTLQTGNSLIDAYLWVKNPGESDGSCGPNQAGTAAPSAGAWWPQYAEMLAANSGW